MSEPITTNEELELGIANRHEDPHMASGDETDNSPVSRQRTSRMRLYVRRFFRNKPAVGGVIIFLFLVICALFGGMLTPFDYTDMDVTAMSAPPGTPGMIFSGTDVITATHMLGTNTGGIDVYAMVMHGVGRSLTIAVTVSLVTTMIAALFGSAAAYLGGNAEKVMLAIINFLLIMPSFLLMALIANHYSGAWKVLIVVMIIFGWMYPARVIWSLSMSVREREYIYAARYMGVRGFSIVAKHIVPNIGSLIVIQFTLGVVSTVMSETGLSFLGFGVKIPDVSLGTMLQDGSGTVNTTPWVFWVAAATLTLLTVSMALISDGLRDALDPNSAAGGKA